MTDSLNRDLAAVVAALAAADRVLIASHENPDGDAIGSMSAAALALRGLGKKVRLYLHPDSPIPGEYEFLNMDGVERSIETSSTAGWTMLALDCGNERRLGPDHAKLRAGFDHVINVDHHHDNFGVGADRQFPHQFKVRHDVSPSPTYGPAAPLRRAAHGLPETPGWPRHPC